jgi:geranylgeranyl pyrophosphate synthase
MLIHLLNNISTQNKQKLHDILDKTREQKTSSEVLWVIDQMKAAGSLDYSKKLADKFSQEAQNVFNTELTFLSQQPFRSQLSDGIDFITTRNH